MEILPAIIPQNIQDLREKCAVVNGSVDAVQIDVCDGVFVSGKSWPYRDDSSEYTSDFKDVIAERAEFPFWDSLNFEVHLMVAQPEKVVRDWISAGASRIVVHVEALENTKQFFADFRVQFPKSAGSLLSVELGLAINLDTPLELLTPYLNEVDFVQLMSIATIGVQGQLFDKRVLGKIDWLHNRYPDLILSVDGGVTLDTSRILVQSGVSRLVVGSAIFGAENVREAVKEFQKIG